MTDIIDPSIAAAQETMQKVGRKLGDIFRPNAYALLVFDRRGRMQYASNVKRQDVVRAMQEFIDKFGGEEPL